MFLALRLHGSGLIVPDLSTFFNFDQPMEIFHACSRRLGYGRGNLSSHMSKLEEAGYIAVTKEFVEKIPRTLIRLTDEGREAIEDYKRNMKHVLDELLG